MSHAGFVHLRVHSAYSLSEGAVRVKDLPKLCKAQGMPAVALTDTDNVFGAMEFAKTLPGAGVQPITGCQLSVTATGGTAPGRQQVGPPKPDQVILLCQNMAMPRSFISDM